MPNRKKYFFLISFTLFLAGAVSAVNYEYKPSTFYSTDDSAEVEFTGLTPDANYQLMYTEADTGDLVEVDSFQASPTGFGEAFFTHDPWGNNIDKIQSGYIYALQYENGTFVDNVYIKHDNFLSRIDTFTDGDINHGIWNVSEGSTEENGVFQGTLNPKFNVPVADTVNVRGIGTFSISEGDNSVEYVNAETETVEMFYNNSADQYQIWADGTLQASEDEVNPEIWDFQFKGGAVTFEDFENNDVGGWTVCSGDSFTATNSPLNGNIQGEYAGEYNYDGNNCVENWRYVDSSEEGQYSTYSFYATTQEGLDGRDWIRIGDPAGNNIANIALQDNSGSGIHVNPSTDNVQVTSNTPTDEWYRIIVDNTDYSAETFDIIVRDADGNEVGSAENINFLDSGISEFGGFSVGSDSGTGHNFYVDMFTYGEGTEAGEFRAFSQTPRNSRQWWENVTTYNPPGEMSLNQFDADFTDDPGVEFNVGDGWTSQFPQGLADSISYRNTANGSVNYLTVETTEPVEPELSVLQPSQGDSFLPQEDVTVETEITTEDTALAFQPFFIHPDGNAYPIEELSGVQGADQTFAVQEDFTVGDYYALNETGEYGVILGANEGDTSGDIPESPDSADYTSQVTNFTVGGVEAELLEPTDGASFGFDTIDFRFETSSLASGTYDLLLTDPNGTEESVATNTIPSGENTVSLNREISPDGTYDWRVRFKSGGVTTYSDSRTFTIVTDDNVTSELISPEQDAEFNYTENNIQFELNWTTENPGQVDLLVEDAETGDSYIDRALETDHPGNFSEENYQFEETLEPGVEYRWESVYTSDLTGVEYSSGSRFFSITAQELDASININSPDRGQVYTVTGDDDEAEVEYNYEVETNKASVLDVEVDTPTGTETLDGRAIGTDGYSDIFTQEYSDTGDYTFRINVSDSQGDFESEEVPFTVRELSWENASNLSDYYYLAVRELFGFDISGANLFLSFLITSGLAIGGAYFGGGALGVILVPLALMFCAIAGLMPRWLAPAFAVVSATIIYLSINESG